MKGFEYQDLKNLVTRAEERREKGELGATLMAIVGLIGFGAMLMPVWFPDHRVPTVASRPLTATTTAPDAYTSAHVLGSAAVVYDLTTGRVLYEKNAEAQLPLASLTKLLTTYAAVTALPSGSHVVITEKALSQDGDSGFKVGESFAFPDLARLALVASSNDAAEAIAESASTRQATSNQNMLASAASAAGLLQTYALNGTGLDVSTSEAGGYGSATDVAKLAGALLTKAPDIARATIEPSITITSDTGSVHTLQNTNQEIGHIPGALLSKTGFTDLAGGNLVVVFDAGLNHPVAVVVLGSTRDGRFADVNQLVSLTLDHFAGIAPRASS